MTLIAGDVRAAVLDWYAGEARDFPWRRTRDPYAVLVSEVMLQQTQAARVVDRFPRFMARFPTTGTLAAASEAAVVAAWSGLGYNRRALALRSAAAIVERDGWPTDVAALERLPGVGPYTARAVASLAFDVPAGVVDTNVRRWLLRRFGGPDNPRQLQELADCTGCDGSRRGRGHLDARQHGVRRRGVPRTRPTVQLLPHRRGLPIPRCPGGDPRAFAATAARVGPGLPRGNRRAPVADPPPRAERKRDATRVGRRRGAARSGAR